MNPISGLVQRKRVTVGLLLTLAFTAFSSSSYAQQPNWQPARLPRSTNAQPLSPTEPSASAADPRPATNGPAPVEQLQQLGNGVVLRWQPSARVNRIAAANQSRNVDRGSAFSSEPSAALGSGSTSVRDVDGMAARRSNDPWLANPLRAQSMVRQANYQQPEHSANDPFKNPFGDSAPSAAPQTLPPGNVPPMNQAADPLAAPESAPAPNSPSQDPKSNPFPELPAAPKEPEKAEEPSPFDKPSESDHDKDKDPSSDKEKTDEDASDLALPSRKKAAGSTVSCDESRLRMRTPLSSINLNTSPQYGEGLATAEEREKDRLDFAATSPVREWADSQGRLLATGRMIDLRNEQVVLDDNGVERCLPMRDLSDADAQYVGKAWNLPISCGNGFEPFVGRNYLASTFQWKAPGLCHKPLYFEEVELERYGHELGPILQPLVSSVHFFGNCAVLPYKMGIHPMSECQYALGYYRPGDCAPYMIPPIPWSLRGAANQAKAVVGAAALIP